MTVRDIGRLSGSEVAEYYDSFPWGEQTLLMKEFADKEPENERSAPTLYIGDVLNDGELIISDGTLVGDPEHTVFFTQYGDRKKYWLFGPLVRKEIDYCANHAASYDQSRRYLKLYLEGKIDELKVAMRRGA